MVERIGLSVDATAPPRIARLTGYRVVFQCPEGEEAAYANIIQPGVEVWGVIYRCGEVELIRLDAFEQGYRRVLLEVTDLRGEVLIAATYLMVHAEQARFGKPTAEYFERIVVGARRHGLPEHYVAELVASARK